MKIKQSENLNKIVQIYKKYKIKIQKQKKIVKLLEDYSDQYLNGHCALLLTYKINIFNRKRSAIIFYN